MYLQSRVLVLSFKCETCSSLRSLFPQELEAPARQEQGAVLVPATPGLHQIKDIHLWGLFLPDNLAVKTNTLFLVRWRSWKQRKLWSRIPREWAGKEGKADHVKLFRSKYPNVLFMLWRDKQIHLPWKPLKVQWEKGGKKCNTYECIIKLALQRSLTLHAIPCPQHSLHFFSHYHICRT